MSAAASDLNDLLIESIVGTAAKGREKVEMIDSEVDGNSSEYHGRNEGLQCNEWGAMLLCDQIMKMVQVFDDEVMTSCDDSIRSKFVPLIWALKVLTLHKPADIKRFIMPVECKGRISTSMLRRLLACRVDFSRDAVLKINLDSVVCKLICA